MADRTTALVALSASFGIAVLATGCDGGTGASGPAPPSVVTQPGRSIALDPGEWDQVSATLSAPGSADVELSLWYAGTPEHWHQGLTGVTDLGSADGMLFEFDREGSYRFHMWQTPMPIDIHFFDSRGGHVGSATMAPCLEGSELACERYTPEGPFLVAIELPASSLPAPDIDERWTLTYDEPTSLPTS